MHRKRAAIYVRVSSQEQAREGYSLEAQVRRLVAYTVSQGWDVSGIYRDAGCSGKDLRRPDVARLLRDAEKGRFDVVLVWKLDRLSRRQRDVLEVVEDVFHPRSIGFVSVTESFDTTTAQGMLMLGVLSAFAQLERSTIVERTRLGLRARLDKGQWNGGAPYGYRYGPDGILTPCPEEAPWLQRIYQAARSTPVSKIVSQLAAEGAPPPHRRHAWHASTVTHILHNRAYLGARRTATGFVPMSHPALIGEALWDEVQEALSARSPAPPGSARPVRGSPSPYLLTGLAWCDECGRRLYGKRVRSRPRRDGQRRLTEYYICQRTKKTGTACGPKWARREQVDALVLKALEQAWPRLVASPEGDGSEMRNLTAGLREVESRLGRLMEAVENGIFSPAEARARMVALRHQKRSAKQALGQLRCAEEGVNQMPSSHPFHDLWDVAEARERQDLLAAVVGRVTVTHGPRVRVEFR